MVTRGTTNPNRLRRVDTWIAYRLRRALLAAPDPLVIDLGYGVTPITAIELRGRLAAAVRPDVRVVGLEIDPVRVAAAAAYSDPPGLTFARGGFELGGLRAVVVRALNVLRQYDESEVAAAWAAMRAASTYVVDGTCDELGRLASWVLLDPTGPVSLTVGARLSTLERPSSLAERLPKALIHHNVPGSPVHAFIESLDAAWMSAAPLGVFGARQRWMRACAALRDAGWPVLDGRTRWRLGELTVDWSAVAPA